MYNKEDKKDEGDEMINAFVSYIWRKEAEEKKDKKSFPFFWYLGWFCFLLF